MSISCFDGSLTSIPEKSYLEVKLWDCSEIPFEKFQTALQASPHLKTLELDHCNQMDDHWIDAMVRKCKNIHTLCLSNCGSITSSMIGAFSKLKELSLENVTCIAPLNLPTNLETLSLSKLSIEDEDLLELKNQLSKLEQLVLSQCGNITAKGISYWLHHESIRRIYLPVQITKEQLSQPKDGLELIDYPKPYIQGS